MEKVELLEKNGVDIKSALGLWGDMTAYNDALKEYKNTFPGKLTSLENYINNMVKSIRKKKIKKSKDWYQRKEG